MATLHEKAKIFQALHQRDEAFVIPNPWDVGTARMLAALGFEALATTSAGFCHSRGRRDGGVSREAALAHAREIVDATHLPVSADLENGYGHTPGDAAATIAGAGDAGLAGASIEDWTGDPDDPIYPLEQARERIVAAVEAARALPHAFTLTARSENYLRGRPDLADTIARLQAFQEAGADVLYAPGLKTREDIETLVRAVDRPVNVVMGLQGVQLSVSDLSAIGVRRISVGSALSRAAYGAFLRAAREIAGAGTFTFADEAASFAEIEALLQDE
jgi:2-methylisocitrate lyase-like PEP mutase family enzyme